MLTACATFVAAGAMAYSNGGSQRYPHQDEAPNTHVASDRHRTAGDAVAQTMTGGADGAAGGGGGGDFAGGQGAPGDQQFADNGPRVYDPGEDRDDHAPSGFMPNGEDGLMTLASYVIAHGGDGGQHENSGDNSDHVPGGFQGQGEQPSGGQGSQGGNQGGGAPGGDGSIVNDGQGGAPGGEGGGFSLGLGGGGGFGGGSLGMGGGSGGGGSGGGGASGGGSNPGGGSTVSPGGDASQAGGSNTNGSHNSGSGGGSDDGGSGGGSICAVSAIDTCGGGSPGPTQDSSLGPQTITTGGGENAIVGGIPEPAVWMMTILGFGALGSALRARRRTALAA